MRDNTPESTIINSAEDFNAEAILNSIMEEFEQAMQDARELQYSATLLPERKDGPKQAPFMPKSFLDPRLQVTKDLHAVSYVKLSNKFMTEKSNRLAAYREHAFLIIQTHKRIYRAEVDQHPKVKDRELLVVQRTHELFDDQEHFIRACKAALKGLIPEEEALEKAPLYHWTWLVSKEKVAELLADIEKDRGDNKQDAQPFPYFRPGNESIFNPEKLPSTIKTALSGMGAYVASDVTRIAVDKVFELTVISSIFRYM